MLLQIGDSILTQEQVVSQIPTNISSADSIALFNAIVQKWINSRLLNDIAVRNITNINDINQMVEDYRNQLIIREYRKMMSNNNSSEISEEELQNYYDQHKNSFILNRPIIQGIFIKIPEKSRQISDLRKWINSPTQENIDKIEKHGLRIDMQYDYFVNQWIDWQNITEQIPYRFGDADEFVKTHHNFEYTYNGSTYFLYISKYLLSGEVMPFEFSKQQIQEILINENRVNYDFKLINSLYNKALKENKIKVGLYDPMKK